MFLLHQELSRREKVSGIWFAIWILTSATVLILLNTLLVRMQANSSFTDFMIIALSVAGIYVLIKKNLVSFKYCIIDNELIVHEVVGTKEKRILNLNVHQIVKFEKAQGACFEKDRQGTYSSKKRLYNCTNKNNRHYIVFEEDGENRWFTFQPSDYMIGLIREKMSYQ